MAVIFPACIPQLWLRDVAGWGAVVTAGGLQLPNGVWAGAGQADSTAAGLV